MITLKDIYILIENAEQQSRKGKVKKAISIYKVACKEIDQLLGSIEDDGVDQDIITAVALLKRNIMQTVRDLENFLRRTNFDFLNSDSIANNTPPSTANTIPSNLRNDNLNSMFQSTKLMTNSLAMWEQDQPIDNFSSDPFLITLLNRLQNTLLDITKTSDHVEEDVSQQFQLFKRDLIWYEQKKFSDFNNHIKKMNDEKKKLENQITRQKELWEGLVENVKAKKR
ncbi:hypothetical protein KAFR_0L01410 [Kazachstania africana CBS 2517]|uniref:Uncharacterized protein n=1 Tax=Kazachstania africana (strain ATCC 22294 / BCRC 22015 / CBS 2517 / CECT 1963 / NBRC 1671 / NRRL Y-8276) TaxID=1071382 RepID=H2B2A0_KAZAF|nr:hypothetical protein KAFR_0L01410 [Kazachstania africana CBS 2517]CCF60750.1 hypothetical protein KAFR_0L01410 [Kazachstania africana CBS 2517]